MATILEQENNCAVLQHCSMASSHLEEGGDEITHSSLGHQAVIEQSGQHILRQGSQLVAEHHGSHCRSKDSSRP